MHPPGPTRYRARTPRPVATLRELGFIWGLCLLSLAGCVSPIAMHRAVLEYDRTVSRVETELLLLNIARARHYLPIHFTAVSSIAATFDFRMHTGVTGIPVEAFSSGVPSLTLTWGASVAENPTISIIPIRGQEFTQRLLTPMGETKLEFLAHQGIDVAIVLRLMARGMILDGYGESRFLLNQPHLTDEYREFRRRILHLSSLNLTRSLHVGPMHFMEGPDRVVGRVAITNYSLETLSNEERRAMHEAAQHYPGNFVLVDIRPGDPGGDYPLHGVIKL